MPKENPKKNKIARPAINKEARRRLTLQILFVIFSILLILSMALSLAIKP
jgi:predicted nucleic acid-binding Zn ribbon protein